MYLLLFQFLQTCYLFSCCSPLPVLRYLFVFSHSSVTRLAVNELRLKYLLQFPVFTAGSGFTLPH